MLIVRRWYSGSPHRENADDLFDHRLRLLQYLVIPKTLDEKTLCLDQVAALFVVAGSLQMLTTIEFDDEFRFQACKIRDETCDLYLASKSIAGDLSATKVAPQQTFRVGRFVTQPTCAGL